MPRAPAFARVDPPPAHEPQSGCPPGPWSRERRAGRAHAHEAVEPEGPGLDVLRGVAILLVLARHQLPPADEVMAPIRVLGGMLQRGGWIGVDLFFVLSGFLVSGLLFTEIERHGDLRIGRFLARRGFKIYPGFYTLLLATLLMQYVTLRIDPEFLSRMLREFLYVQNYAPGLLCVHVVARRRGALLSPLAAAAGSRLSARRDWIPLARAARGGHRRARDRYPDRSRLARLADPYDLYTHHFPTHIRADSLLWGVLLGWVYHTRPRHWLVGLRAHRWAVLLVVMTIAAPAFVWPVNDTVAMTAVGFSAFAVAFTLLVALTIPSDATASRRPGALERWVAGVGRDSYAIYLWQGPTGLWILQPLQRTGAFAFASPTAAYLATFGAFVALSIVTGMVAARVVERPALALRERVMPSRSGPSLFGRGAPVARRPASPPRGSI